MRWKAVVLTLVLDVVFFCMVAISGAAAQQSGEPPCQTPYESESVRHKADSGWSYDYRLVWCAAEGEITWWEPVVDVVVSADSECVWEGSKNIPLPVPESNDLNVLNIGILRCVDGSAGRPRYENPWSIVGISPAGRSWITAMGIS